MLVREAGEGAVVIGQPAHAWLSGQLARAWGNGELPPPEPREEVCLGATQHDIGMTDWDNAPRLDPETGLPYSFLDMPLEEHVALWSRAGRRVLPQSRYAALLVSLHGTGLYERRDLSRQSEEAAAAVREYLESERAWQDEVVAALRADPAYAKHATGERLDANRALVRAWDWLSICLCLELAPQTVGDLDDSSGEAVQLTLRRSGAERWTLDPWPFAERALSLVCEGRELDRRYGEEAEMRAALARAPWVTVRFELSP